MVQESVNSFLDIVAGRKMYSSKSNLRFYLKNLFENIEVAGKNVLDVGGGSGILSLYAAVNGAKNVICLEPEKDGSKTGMTKGFHDLRKELPAPLSVALMRRTLQEYMLVAPAGMFDVVIMHNSINHLNEDACIHLLERDDCYQEYVSIFKNLFKIMQNDGVLVVTDCSRHNFFNDIGVRNLFVPTIEWHKHQQPGTWISVLKAAGFRSPTIKWLTPNHLREPGRLIMGNYLVSYLTRSYFKVTVKK